MSMPRLVPLVLLLAALPGCEYAPLAVDENLPDLSGAVVDPDVILYGTSIMKYTPRRNDGLTCQVVHDIVGWEGSPAVSRGCTTCSTTYTLYRTANEDETTCPDLPPQTHAIGWDIVDNVRDDPWSGGSGDNAYSTEEWLALPDQSDAVGALRTTWTVSGFTEDPVWTTRFVLREVDEDEWPDAPDAVEFTRAYTARDRWIRQASSEQYVAWRIDLQFTD
jgi:hypothetical protein